MALLMTNRLLLKPAMKGVLLAAQEEVLRRLKETEALVERFSNENERLASQIDLMRTQTRTAGDYKGGASPYPTTYDQGRAPLYMCTT